MLGRLLKVSCSVALGWSLTGACFAEGPDYTRDIRPILSNNCYTCHGPDEETREADFRLDILEDAIEYGAITPGKPNESLLLDVIHADNPDDIMPPLKTKRTLSAEQKQLLHDWIKAGADYSPHWAFQAPTSPTLPDTAKHPSHSQWASDPLDYFILDRLSQEGLLPAEEANRETLIRRVTFDLTGLPPTLEETEAFLNDPSPDAYKHLVKRLLASKAYAEHSASQWLDVARFADTFGYQGDKDNRLWPWRDWAIRAFDSNLPYDDFIRYQLAGDLLPNPSTDQRLATAFNRLHRQTNEGGSVNEEFRVEYNADRVEAFGTAFLGLTMECARCHDHKYDPVSKKNYYQFMAFFDKIDESGLYSHYTSSTPTPTMMLYDDESRKKHEELRLAITKEEKLGDEIEQRARNRYRKWLHNPQRPIEVPSPVVHLNFDEAPKENKLVNLADESKQAEVNGDYRATEKAKSGKAVWFTGDAPLKLKEVAKFERYDSFSIGMWIYIEELLPHMMLAHRCVSESDAASRGYELMLNDGRFVFSLNHFWPGDALRVHTSQEIPIQEWVHLTATYDGTSKASGVRLYINGKPVEFDVLRDKLKNKIRYGGNNPALSLGERNRDVGFTDGRMDDFYVYDHVLSPLEVEVMVNGADLSEAITQRIATDPETKDLFEYYAQHIDTRLINHRADLRKAHTEESNHIDTISSIMVMEDDPTIRTTFTLGRGEYTEREHEVHAGTPEAFLAFPTYAPRNRLGLTQWLLDPQHPLTSRVVVNRYWQQIFGQGIVTTPEDFGIQGELPSHPELLDHMAQSFRESGWDVKALFKRMVMSSTYKQASKATPKALATDPQNRLLSHGPQYRRSAEEIRDAALTASGLLTRHVGGPSVKPYQPEGLWKESSSATYTPDKGDKLYRRSMYTYIKRTVPPPSMLTFDATSREVCVVRRERTTTPLQALVLMNDPQYVEAARVLAERTIAEVDGDSQQRIDHIFRTLLTRQPTDQEQGILTKAYKEQLAWFLLRPDEAKAYLSVGEYPRNETLDLPQTAAMTALTQALMNQDEFQVKR